MKNSTNPPRCAEGVTKKLSLLCESVAEDGLKLKVPSVCFACTSLIEDGTMHASVSGRRATPI
jgi:hypothetical protein